jgi:hypothetical protein
MSDIRPIDGNLETTNPPATENPIRKHRSRSDGGESKGLARAFRELEPDICDLGRAGELASLAEDAGDDGLLCFALGQFQKTAEDLKRKYYERYEPYK